MYILFYERTKREHQIITFIWLCISSSLYHVKYEREHKTFFKMWHKWFLSPEAYLVFASRPFLLESFSHFPFLWSKLKTTTKNLRRVGWMIPKSLKEMTAPFWPSCWGVTSMLWEIQNRSTRRTFSQRCPWTNLHLETYHFSTIWGWSWQTETPFDPSPPSRSIGMKMGATHPPTTASRESLPWTSCPPETNDKYFLSITPGS